MNYNQYNKNNPNFKHGHTKSRIYTIWMGIKQRCYNKNTKSYKDYGARGIIMCRQWLNNSKSFIEWAQLNGYNDKLVIDRKDYNGNYEPSNCRWVNLEVSNVNKSKQKGTSSKYIGVSWNTRDKKWKS